MNDAISRSAAIDIINEERRFIESLRETVYDNEDRAHNTGELGCAIRLARNIKELPALDVAPVVHARWIMNHFGAKCSNCLRLYCVEPSWSEKIKHMPPTWIYCPNCGAKMDGEAE